MISEKVLNKLEELKSSLLTANINNNKQEKEFRYHIFDLYEDIFKLIQKEFATQEDIDDYSIYFSLYKNELHALKDKLIECSIKYKDRASLASFLAQLSTMVQAKIDACGGKINI